MNRNLRLMIAIVLVVLVALAVASLSQGATAPGSRRPAAAPARTPVSARAPAAARQGATAARERTGAPRTLEPIHIEGEIPVPQVLFITAREQRRFVEFHHRRYLRTSRQLGEATVSPDWIIVNRDPITPEQEKAR